MKQIHLNPQKCDFMDNEERINECRKNQWIEAWFAIEAVGVSEEVVKESLENLVKKMGNIKSLHIYEKNFRSIEKMEEAEASKIRKDLKEAWNQVVELRLFTKTLTDLINVIYLYGPSAVEILGPETKEVGLHEIQDIANSLSGLLHQFAAAGIGGVVITPK